MPIRRETPGGPEPAYRAYEIGDDDRVVSSEVVEADTDDDAIRVTRDIANGRAMELWDRGRLVIRIAAPAGRG